jgi:hypothetical protein
LYPKSIKLSLFLGSLSNLPAKLAFHARSPPDGFLTSLPDFEKIRHANKEVYLEERPRFDKALCFELGFKNLP